MRLLLGLFLFFISACNPKKLDEQKEMYGVRYASGGKTSVYYQKHSIAPIKLEEPNCKDGLADLGKMSISLIDKKSQNVENERIDNRANKKYTTKKTDINLKGVKGNPISSQFINSVRILKHEKLIKEGCETHPLNNGINSKKRGIKTCQSYHEEVTNPGQEARICKKGGGYNEDSLENHVLGAVASVQKTLECYNSFFPTSTSFPKLDLIVFPTEELVFHMKDGTTESTYKTDNAYHMRTSGRTRPQILFFQNDATNTNFYSPLTLNLGIGSHETGHHIFMLYTGAAANLVEYQAGLKHHQNYRVMTHDRETVRDTREINSRLVFNAINEGIADAVATLCFFENDFATLAFSAREAAVRSTSKNTIRVRNPKNNHFIEIPKTLNNDRLRHFFSQTKSKSEMGSASELRDIDDKDEHHIGAIALYGLFQYWKALKPDYDFLKPNWMKKEDESVKRKTLQALRKMLIESIYNVGQVIPNKEPSIYLDDLIFALIKGEMEKDPKTGKLSVPDKVCGTLKEQFPINFIGFQNNFTCL